MILKGIGFAILAVGLFLLATYVVMRLWNWLIPSLFNGPRLRFVQALGLFFLTRLLFGFGGLGHGGHYGYGRHRSHFGYDGLSHSWHHGGHGWHQRDNRDVQPEKRRKLVVPSPVPNQ